MGFISDRLIPCPVCGYKNGPGRGLCTECGELLSRDSNAKKVALWNAGRIPAVPGEADYSAYLDSLGSGIEQAVADNSDMMACIGYMEQLTGNKGLEICAFFAKGGRSVLDAALSLVEGGSLSRVTAWKDSLSVLITGGERHRVACVTVVGLPESGAKDLIQRGVIEEADTRGPWEVPPETLTQLINILDSYKPAMGWCRQSLLAKVASGKLEARTLIDGNPSVQGELSGDDLKDIELDHIISEGQVDMPETIGGKALDTPEGQALKREHDAFVRHSAFEITKASVKLVLGIAAAIAMVVFAAGYAVVGFTIVLMVFLIAIADQSRL